MSNTRKIKAKDVDALRALPYAQRAAIMDSAMAGPHGAKIAELADPIVDATLASLRRKGYRAERTNDGGVSTSAPPIEFMASAGVAPEDASELISGMTQDGSLKHVWVEPVWQNPEFVRDMLAGMTNGEVLDIMNAAIPGGAPFGSGKPGWRERPADVEFKDSPDGEVLMSAGAMLTVGLRLEDPVTAPVARLREIVWARYQAAQ